MIYFMKYKILFLILIITSIGVQANCHKYAGDWWLESSNENFWIKETYLFSQNCEKISVKRTTYFYGETEVDTSTHTVTSGWTFRNRWQADNDQRWYSHFGLIHWKGDMLAIKTQLFREVDNQLAWDFTTWKDFSVPGLLVKHIVQHFPIENSSYEFHEEWVRQKP